MAVRDSAHRGACRIHYKDIGDYLTREEKLRIVRNFGSIAGIADWQAIVPDAHHDWLDQRDPAYQVFMPLGSKEAKSRKSSKPGVAIRSYSSGIKTNCDAWLYSFDRDQLAHRLHILIETYETARRRVEVGEVSAESATCRDALNRIKWYLDLRQRLFRGLSVSFQESCIRSVLYRPFVSQHLYYERILVQRVHQLPSMFPTPAAPNQVIGATGRGATTPFSTLITDFIPDLELVSKAQWFARWRYEVHDPHSLDAWAQTDNTDLDAVPGYRRVDNITDWQGKRKVVKRG